MSNYIDCVPWGSTVAEESDEESALLRDGDVIEIGNQGYEAAEFDEDGAVLVPTE